LGRGWDWNEEGIEQERREDWGGGEERLR